MLLTNIDLRQRLPLVCRRMSGSRLFSRKKKSSKRSLSGSGGDCPEKNCCVLERKHEQPSEESCFVFYCLPLQMRCFQNEGSQITEAAAQLLHLPSLLLVCSRYLKKSQTRATNRRQYKRCTAPQQHFEGQSEEKRSCYFVHSLTRQSDFVET